MIRILLSNKFYYRRGGDCIYMLNLEQLLKLHGHEVAVFSMDYPENINTPWKKYFPSNMTKFNVFSRPLGSKEVKNKFSLLLDAFQPDVVHLNNIHTQLSPVIAEIAHQRGIKVVWTLHDYKLLCPRYDCLRNGKEICESCFEGNKTYCRRYKCIKGSWMGSWIGCREAEKWNRKRLENCTDVFLCPSKFMAAKMEQGGFGKSKLKQLYNFIDVEKCYRDDYEKDDYYCYVGRLSHEKGVKTLIEAARKLEYRLLIVGRGALSDMLKSMCKDSRHIEFVGFKQWNDIKEIVGKARFLVVPSEWYENNPLSIIEAQCLGTPVLGACIGGIPELIKEGVTGMTFESRSINDLSKKIEMMFNSYFDYNFIARSSQERYHAETYYNEIMKIYQK